VADLSIMLALMAGRNGGRALAHVRNGEVRVYAAPHLRPRSLDPTESGRLVAQRILVSLRLVRPPVERQRG